MNTSLEKFRWIFSRQYCRGCFVEKIQKWTTTTTLDLISPSIFRLHPLLKLSKLTGEWSCSEPPGSKILGFEISQSVCLPHYYRLSDCKKLWLIRKYTPQYRHTLYKYLIWKVDQELRKLKSKLKKNIILKICSDDVDPTTMVHNYW